MLKNFIKYALQKLFGLKTYLFLFSLFMIKKLSRDKRERAFIKFIELIKDSGHMLDVGANIGVMTYHFSKKLPKSTIHSFEPIPVNFNNLARIKQKYRLNNVILYKHALGNSNGEIQIVLPKVAGVYLHGLSHVFKGEEPIAGIKHNVAIKRLDDMDGFLQMPVTAIKIDVENYEYEVLLGAEKLICKNRPLIYCELWMGENRRKSFEFLCRHNYSAFVLQCNMLTSFDGQSHHHNFFFIPVERIEDLKLL